MALNLDNRIELFSSLGELLLSYCNNKSNAKNKNLYNILDYKIEKARQQNPWFTNKNIFAALRNIGLSLGKKQIKKWLNKYSELKKQVNNPLTIGIVNAGNIPLVGFHDFLTILITGNIYYGKLSSKDKELPKAIAEILIEMEPELKKYIFFEEENLKKFDAIIATGSDNTSRYFEYYFSKYPHIIRKNRSSAAILTEDETDEELKKLADDIFLYFGLGCRNVSKLFVPSGYSFDRFFENLNHYKEELKQHNKYSNNYDYNRTIFLMNQTPHLDNGFVLLKEDPALSSPIATIFYETYSDLEQVNNYLEAQKEQIQCVVSHSNIIKHALPFGEAQKPSLWDYDDNIDTVEFILSLDK